MKNLFRNSSWLVVGAACASFAISASAQSIGYQNLANPSSAYYSFVTGTSVGNEISMAGGGGPLQNFIFDYYGSASGAAWAGTPTFQVTLYANDGPPIAGVANSAQPSTVLGQTPVESLTLPSTLSGGTTFAQETLSASDFSVGTLKTLPADFTFTVQVAGTGAGDKVGLYFFGPPTQDGGNTFNDYWVNTASGAPGSWGIETATGQTYSLFGAEVVLVPEPTTLALSVFGGLGFLMMARRFRK